MRSYLGLLPWCALALVAGGCGDDDCGGRSRCGPIDSSIPDVGFDTSLDAMDSSEERCTASTQCADEHACTADDCAPSGICRHTPRSDMCGGGMTCSPAAGCVAGCSNNEDCNDGQMCNGVEMCVRMECVNAESAPSLVHPVECNDGNDCTEDRCDEDAMGCVSINMCDSGVGHDGGGPDPFDPATGYAGRFVLGASMGLSTTCTELPGGGFGISTVTFTNSGSLTVMGGGITMTGTSPTGASFRVTGTYGCGVFTMEGTFTDSENFSGTFNADLGGCGSCSSTNAMITGARL